MEGKRNGEKEEGGFQLVNGSSNLQLIGQWDRTHGAGINAPSRLAQTLGLNARVQSFQAFNTCYKDTGLVGVYFVCEETGVMPVVDAITQQWLLKYFL